MAVLAGTTLIAPLSVQAGGGTITFQGALVTPTCVVTAPNQMSNQTSNASGPSAVRATFDIRLTQCADASVGTKIYRDTGVVVDPSTGMLISSGGAEAPQALRSGASAPELSIMYTMVYN
jgi:type 1 fimbria pilin